MARWPLGDRYVRLLYVDPRTAICSAGRLSIARDICGPLTRTDRRCEFPNPCNTHRYRCRSRSMSSTGGSSTRVMKISGLPRGLRRDLFLLGHRHTGGGLYWPRATRRGAIAALIAGFTAIVGLGPVKEALGLGDVSGPVIGFANDWSVACGLCDRVAARHRAIRTTSRIGHRAQKADCYQPLNRRDHALKQEF